MSTPLPQTVREGAVSPPLVAREGWGHITLAVAAAVLATGLWGIFVAAPLWLFAIFVLQFFRDPRRVLAEGEDAVLCPADGRVIAVGPVEDPYLKRAAIKCSIFMNVFNVHSNRLPVAGRVRRRWYNPGRFVNAALDKASEHNERNALWITTAGGDDVVVVQVAGLIARRILCYVGEGEVVERGRRYGFIRFGSRVDVYLPPSAHPEVALGDKVKAGSQILARLAGPDPRVQ
ncbi:phosphatidylserine decarboxylase [Acidiferrobacter sp.]|uniref:phosphatidylserine decarboxylase n=1 Tax=Acidiferrobacter sp. TaxID=1872107 RepID=UPI002634511D|nr:phosphatidylserine decarboxylase [Acidiferrobacter sp.]